MTSLYGDPFEEKGRRFEAYLPSTSTEPQEFIVKVYRNGTHVDTLTIHMTHESVFGPDAADVAELEKRIGEYIDKLE